MLRSSDDPFANDEALSFGIGGDRFRNRRVTWCIFAVETGSGTEVSSLTTDC